jgi:hypothetical protein
MYQTAVAITAQRQGTIQTQIIFAFIAEDHAGGENGL